MVKKTALQEICATGRKSANFGIVVFAAILAMMMTSCSRGPAPAATLAAPVRTEEAEPAATPVATEAPRTQTEIDEHWLQDVYREFAGALLHGEGAPRAVTLGGRKWTRTNGSIRIKLRPTQWVSARLYDCDGDPSRRLTLFLDVEPSEDFALLLLLESQVQVEGDAADRKWITDGHRVDFHGWPGQRKFYCNAVTMGKTATRLTPHKIHSNGSIVPYNGGVAVSEPWK